MDTTVRTRGLPEFMRAAHNAGKETEKQVRVRFRNVGEIVRADASPLLARYDQESAAGLRVYVRRGGVSVEQSKRRTTGQHPEYGRLQMEQALTPALERNADRIDQEFERALADIEDVFKRG